MDKINSYEKRHEIAGQELEAACSELEGRKEAVMAAAQDAKVQLHNSS